MLTLHESKVETCLQLTLPQDEVAALGAADVFPLSISSSSAKPHEQSLQALRFPVVPQTAKRNEITEGFSNFCDILYLSVNQH